MTKQTNVNHDRLLKDLKDLNDKTKGKIPLGSYTVLAILYDYSRERVRQLAMREGYLPAHEIRRLEKVKTCPVCKTVFIASNSNRIYDKMECRWIVKKEKFFMKVPCNFCGKEKLVLKNQHFDKHRYFCDRVCMGKWLAHFKVIENTIGIRELTKRVKRGEV